GVCEQKSRGNPLNEDGVRRGRDRVPECRFGWGYHMLNLITEIAPRFHLAASIGPISLSVIADDIEGATALFEKALKLFPNDWLLHYQAGYHHLFELEDKGAALAHFERANLLGAPGWLPLLIARLHSELGRQAVAVSVLKSLVEKGHHDRRVIERAEGKLKSLSKKETGAEPPVSSKTNEKMKLQSTSYNL